MPPVSEPLGSLDLLRQMPNGLTPNLTYPLVAWTALSTSAMSLLTFWRRQSASFLPLPYFVKAAASSNVAPCAG